MNINIKNLSFIILLFFILFGCFKQSKTNDIESYYFKDNANPKKNILGKQLKLPIAYKKLEPFLGSNFIPVFSTKTNLDKDIADEICVAFKANDSQNIKICFFDLFSKGIIKKKFEFETSIYSSESFLLQSNNLFYEDDISIIIEGKSIENKSLLYILSFLENDYKLAGEFTGDFSVIIDYEEKEYEKGKYFRLKEVVTIDNSFSSTNTTIQQKSIFTWDYENFLFKLVETSQILSLNTSINRSIFISEESFLNYIKGFWYPEKYKKIIKNDKLDANKYNSSNIKFISFSVSPNEVSIKHEDYMNKYSILKINRLWGQKPGLRLKIKGISKTSNYKYKKIEIFLMEADKLMVSGPKRFSQQYYVRLARPFIEYVNEKKEEKIKNEQNVIAKYLMNEFRSDDNIILNFTKNNEFIIKRENSIEKGIYKITKDTNGFIISFLFKTANTILRNNDFIIKISNDSHFFSLISVKMDLDGFVIENVKSIIFYKVENNG